MVAVLERGVIKVVEWGGVSIVASGEVPNICSVGWLC